MKYRIALIAVLSIGVAADASAQLRGSLFSMQRQYQVARDNEFTFAQDLFEARELITAGYLVKLETTRDFIVKSDIQLPYARPAVKLFIERIAAEYRRATGDKLVITSLTRPLSRQPRNASDLSVHPAGMAVDFRMPRGIAHRRWLEKRLLVLENEVVLDVTRERKPAHYHVAVFPREYERYVASLNND